MEVGAAVRKGEGSGAGARDEGEGVSVSRRSRSVGVKGDVEGGVGRRDEQPEGEGGVRMVPEQDTCAVAQGVTTRVDIVASGYWWRGIGQTPL